MKIDPPTMPGDAGPEELMNPSRNVAAAVLCAVLIAFAFACVQRGAETPQQTLELALDHVRKEEYRKIWPLFTKRYHRKLEGEYAEHKAIFVRSVGTSNEEGYRTQIQSQYGVSAERFLELSAAELHANVVELQRDTILALKVGEARVEGDTAMVDVVVSGGQKTVWIFVRQDGRWLIDQDGEPPGDLPPAK
jgi:hypothetical protein